MKIVNGDLCFAKEKYIAHQTNCVTTTWSGVAGQLFNLYEYSNTYKERIDTGNRSVPGTIDIMGNGEDQRYIINMNAQYYPRNAEYENDTPEMRLKYFEKCLNLMSKIKNLDSVAFPYLIGCGLAQGKWQDYEERLIMFDDFVDAEVVLYRYNPR